jgi:hypothetical protein
MKNREIARQVDALRALIAKTRMASGDDLEVQSHWARYLCVLVAGFLENSLAEVYVAFCEKQASVAVARYARASLRRIQNPKAQLFLDVARSFSDEWAGLLGAFLDDDGRKEAINSIMANRHLIAHGKSSGITVARVNEYFRKGIDVVEFLEDQCER